MFRRREILQAMAGAGAMVGMGSVAPAAAASAMGAKGATAMSGLGSAAMRKTTAGLPLNGYDLLYRATSRRRRETDALYHLPAHVANKRSWSPVFKTAVAAREEEIMQAYRKQMTRDRKNMDAFCEMMGLPRVEGDDD